MRNPHVSGVFEGQSFENGDDLVFTLGILSKPSAADISPRHSRHSTHSERFGARMEAGSARKVAQMLENVGLSIYLPRLLDEGFDDVGTLRDITEDDMVKLGIGAEDRRTLHRIVEQLRKEYKTHESAETRGSKNA